MAGMARVHEFDLVIVLATLGAFFSSPIALVILNPPLEQDFRRAVQDFEVEAW